MPAPYTHVQQGGSSRVCGRVAPSVGPSVPRKPPSVGPPVPHMAPSVGPSVPHKPLSVGPSVPHKPARQLPNPNPNSISRQLEAAQTLAPKPHRGTPRQSKNLDPNQDPNLSSDPLIQETRRRLRYTNSWYRCEVDEGAQVSWPSPFPQQPRVAIIGGGLAGLMCARGLAMQVRHRV